VGGEGSDQVNYSQGNSQPNNDFPPDDEARRKQADERRPMIMRRILVWDMDEKLDLEDRFRRQLRGELTDEEPSNGRSGIEEDGRRGH
jgi:hypothetical protein